MLVGSAAHGASLREQVIAIEGEFGANPAETISRLRPIEAQARANQGEDLEAFLAAWGYAHAITDKPSVADAAIEELTEIGERTNSPAALANAYTLKATSLQVSGQVRAAFGWVESAVPLARAAGNADLSYWVFMTAGDLANINGQIDEGTRLLESAAEAAQQIHNPRREAQAYLALAPMRIVRNDFKSALSLAERVRERASHSNDISLVAAGWVMEALAAEALGDGPRAARARREAAAVPKPPSLSGDTVNSQAGGEGWLSSETDALLGLSTMHLGVGNFGAARDMAQRAHQLALAQRDEYSVAIALVDTGLAELNLGHVQAGMKAASAGLALLKHREQGSELLVQLNRYVSALERHGESSESWLRLRESLLLETELARRDRKSTVIELQRESSYQQRQRQLEQLQHDNSLQAAEISRRVTERTLTLLLAAAMFAGVVIAWRLYLRARESNRRLAENNQSLAFASTHDAVTGLFNRRAMEADTAAFAQGRYCCVSLSVKQFGSIVGSVGHQLGDELLCQIASRLNAVVSRYGGRLYRIDGVNFGAVVTMDDDRTLRLDRLLQELAGSVEAPFEIGHQDLIVSIGLGAAQFPKDADSALEVARLAELAKLQTHTEPGTTHVVYDARIGEYQRDKLVMEARMLKALDHGDFEVFYQGQRDVSEGRFTGFEALLRWRDGDKMISPLDFIPLAEETGLIVRLGAWVLRQSCLQAKAWADEGLGRPKVAVNISPRQFNHPEFLNTVRETLQDTHVDPAQIELEITEGSVMNDAEASIAQLHALRDMGLQLAIDDFGTGYASLSYLRRFPLTRLKIDRSFVKQLGANSHDDTIVRTVIELAHCLGLSVTAEGVETFEQEAMLSAWSCDIVQGFLHSRPGPAAGATQLLQAQRVAAEAADSTEAAWLD